MTYKNGTIVLYRQQRCACVGGGWTEMEGTIVDTLNTPTGLWYKISTDYQGTFVVKPENIIRTADGN